MGIRPIDLQVSISKTNDFSKEVNQIKHKSDVQQMHFAHELQQKVQQNQKQVTTVEKSIYNKVDSYKDHKNRQKENGSSEEKDHDQSDVNGESNMTNENFEEENKGLNIDIKI